MLVTRGDKVWVEWKSQSPNGGVRIISMPLETCVFLVRESVSEEHFRCLIFEYADKHDARPRKKKVAVEGNAA